MANLFEGYLISGNVTRLIAAVALGVEDADDRSVVRFVYTGEATTRQDAARQSTEDSHTDLLDQ